MLGTAGEAADLVRQGVVTPQDLTDEALRRAQRWQSSTNAFSSLHPDDARRDARLRAGEAKTGRARGPLHGIPVAVKDLFDVAGWETSGCCQGYAGRIAMEDAPVVRRLRDAGAVIIGKTNQHELAAGATNLVSACGPTHNPWDPTRLTGGSSGGSGAAVAARVVPAALGTDTGGSIRIPASLCGVVGLKPTHGRVSLEGVMPLAPSMDTVGPLTTSVEDAALVFSILTGGGDAFLEESSGPIAGITVGLPGGVFAAHARADVMEACGEATEVLEAAGARATVLLGDLPYDPEDWDRIGWSELARAHGHLLDRPGAVHARTRGFIERGMRFSAAEVAAAREAAAALREAFLRLFQLADALLVPATPVPAPRLDERVVDVGGASLDARAGALSLLTRPVNLAGLPALALPAGFSAEGMPIGIQLIGRPGEEATLLRLGRAFQSVTDHHRRAPPERKGSGGSVRGRR